MIHIKHCRPLPIDWISRRKNKMLTEKCKLQAQIQAHCQRHIKIYASYLIWTTRTINYR